MTLTIETDAAPMDTPYLWPWSQFKGDKGRFHQNCEFCRIKVDPIKRELLLTCRTCGRKLYLHEYRHPHGAMPTWEQKPGERRCWIDHGCETFVFLSPDDVVEELLEIRESLCV